jgi:polysaccharide biosynthesis transport protein
MKLQRGPAMPLAHEPGETPAVISASAPTDNAFSDEQFIRLNLRRALQLHPRLALGCAVAGMLLALAYAIIQWPVYTAKSQIYVQPVQPKVMTPGNDQNGSINAGAYDAYIQQQVQSASSPAVLASALKKLSSGAWQRNSESEQAAAERLGHSIEAARVGTGYEVLITARASDPVLSANIANAIADSIAEKASGEGNAGDAQRIAVLRDERDRILSELKSDYIEQDDLNRLLGMASVGPVAPDLIDDQISKTRDELTKAQTEHDQAEAKFSAMRAGQSDTSAAMNAEAEDLIAADAGLSSMKTSLNQRRATLITQMVNLTPQNTGYKLAADELSKINNSLDAMMKDLRSSAAARIQQKLRTDLERTARVEDQLNGQLRQLARTAAGATPKLQRVNDLATDIVRLRNRFSLVDEQLHNLMVEDSAPGAVHVSVTAVPPLHPSMGRILKGALPLALGGILLGLLAAVVVNKLDPRVYIAADIEESLGFAPMAVLPDFDEVSHGVAAEYLMRLAAAIEHGSRKSDLQTCIFTGTSSRTGVTTVAERLKDALAALSRPAVLLNATGYATRESSETAASAVSLKRFAARTEVDQDSLVLVDTAPLVLSAETEYLSRSADGALVVIQSGVTTRAQLLATVNSLQRLEVGAVGFVLNRVSLTKADPAFRHSLHEIEKHLRNQGASSSMWPVRWHGVIDAPPRTQEHAVRENTLPPQSTQRHEAAGLSAASTVVEFSKAPPELPSQSKPALPDAELPWWLLPPSSQIKPGVPANTVEACAAEPVQSVCQESAPPSIHAPKLPDWFWEGGASGTGDFTCLAAEHAAAASEQIPPDTESRLDRLRGLFSNVGLANLHRNRGNFTAGEQPQPTAPIAAPGGFNSTTAEPAPVAPPVVKGPDVVISIPITAKPEIRSPKEYVPVKEPKHKAAAGKDWRDDEIHILPAKRGQYGSR